METESTKGANELKPIRFGQMSTFGADLRGICGLYFENRNPNSLSFILYKSLKFIKSPRMKKIPLLFSLFRCFSDTSQFFHNNNRSSVAFCKLNNLFRYGMVSISLPPSLSSRKALKNSLAGTSALRLKLRSCLAKPLFFVFKFLPFEKFAPTIGSRDNSEVALPNIYSNNIDGFLKTNIFNFFTHRNVKVITSSFLNKMTRTYLPTAIKILSLAVSRYKFYLLASINSIKRKILSIYDFKVSRIVKKNTLSTEIGKFEPLIFPGGLKSRSC